MAEGNADQALDELKTLATSQPKNPEVFDLLAQIYKSLGKPDQANEAQTHARSLRKKAP
jgi:predicted Zn-dependent protease